MNAPNTSSRILSHCFLFGLLMLAPILPSAVLGQVEKPFLWRIERPEPSFLFGTVHLSDPEVVNLPAAVIKAQNRSTVTVVEVDFDAEIADEVWYLPDHLRLSHFLSSDEIARILQILHLEFPWVTAADIDDNKPWALENILISIYRDADYEPDPILDEQLEEQARGADKEVRYLETPEEQIAALDSIPFDYQLESLMWVVTWLEYQGSLPPSDTIIDHYLSGDEVAFLDYMNESDPEYLDAMLSGRNVTMSARLDDMMRSEPHQSFFVAVGVGHLAGPQPINDYLQEMGYRITRIEQNDWVWVTHPMLHENWRHSHWLGFFAADEGADWTFHRDLGWIRIAGTDSDQFHFYLPSVGWLWTRADIFPACFHLEEDRWVHLQGAAGAVTPIHLPLEQ